MSKIEVEVATINAVARAMANQAKAEIREYNRTHPPRFAVKKGRRRWYDIHKYFGLQLRPTFTDEANRQIFRDLDWAQKIAKECQGKVVDLGGADQKARGR